MPHLANHRVSTTREASGEDYYGGGGAAVPFKWESQPGTPKRHFKHTVSDSDCDSSITTPPLTPPPSYYYSCSSPKLINPKHNTLLGSVLRKNRSQKASASSSPSSSESSCRSVPSSPARSTEYRGARRVSNKRMWFGYGSNDKNKCGGCYGSIMKVLAEGDRC